MNYRRLLFAGMAVLLICSFVAAQEEGIGLTPKLEFGIGNVNEGNDGSRSILITPGVEYENAFLDGALDVFAELDYTIGIPEKGDTDHLVYLEEEVGYNLGLGDAMTLSIILNNQNNFLVSPEAPSGFDPFDGVLEPSLKFTYGADFGEIWVQAGLPIGYAPFAGAYGAELVAAAIASGASAADASFDGPGAGITHSSADKTIEAKLTLAYYSTFGLGLELTPKLALSPDSEYSGFDILVNYETGPVYAEVEVNLPKEIDDGGVTVTPEFDYSLNAFTFYIKSEFAGIGADGDIEISPALGVKYSF